MTDDARVPVTVEDREAAAVIAHSLGRHIMESSFRTGKLDHYEIVQGIARHRLAGVAAGREEAAAYLEAQAGLYRYAQGNASVPTDKTYRMGQKDACLLEAAAIRQRGE